MLQQEPVNWQLLSNTIKEKIVTTVPAEGLELNGTHGAAGYLYCLLVLEDRLQDLNTEFTGSVADAINDLLGSLHSTVAKCIEVCMIACMKRGELHVTNMTTMCNLTVTSSKKKSSTTLGCLFDG